jgi:hypothetical protein
MKAGSCCTGVALVDRGGAAGKPKSLNQARKLRVFLVPRVSYLGNSTA